MRRVGVLLTAALLLFSNGGITVNASTNKLINETSNKKTISIVLGSTIAVQLHSTYWTFNKLDGKSLKSVSAPVAAPIMPGSSAPANCQIAGSGCGTVTWQLKAISKGTTTVSAIRTSCGEAMRCAPDQSTFSVRITVK